MTPRDLALAYLDAFCAADLEGIATHLAADFRLRGPLYRCDSAADYLDSLRRDPPEPCDYELLDLCDDGEHIALFYRYLKPQGPLEVAQLLRITDGRIRHARLIFDSAGLRATQAQTD